MLRAVVGVIVGYVAMAVMLFALFSIAYAAMGAERAYQPASFAVSGLWIGVSIVVGFFAAMVGGWVCRLIAQRVRPVVALAIIVGVLGIGAAGYCVVTHEEPGERAGDVAMFDAMNQSVQPLWVAWLNPVLGIVGVLIGGRAIGAETSPTQPQREGERE